jgi:NHL repeat-containing protein
MERFYRGGFGRRGGGLPGGFFDTRGIAVGTNGDLYVIDSYEEGTFQRFDRIERFDKFGRFMHDWGGFGTGNGQFNSPTNIAIDVHSNFDVYVTDTGNNRVQRFDRNGVFLNAWGELGRDDGEFDQPKGIAVESDGSILVVDSNNFRIQKFTSEGDFIRKWGGRGSSNNQFQQNIDGIAVDSNDDNYVIQGTGHIFANWCVKKFHSDGSFVKEFGSIGENPGQFHDVPRGIAIFGDSVAVATPSGIPGRGFNVHEFTRDGVFITRFCPAGTGEGQSLAVRFIAITDTTFQGNICYTTSDSNLILPMVMKFSTEPGPIDVVDPDALSQPTKEES